MNEHVMKALRAQAEARQAFNSLATDADEAAVTEKREALNDADQAAIEAFDKYGSTSAPAELSNRIRLGNYMSCVAEDRAIEGAEREMNQELKLPEHSVPLEALLPIAEERADAISPQNTSGAALGFGDVNQTVGPVLQRVFAQTDSVFLGISMPTVPPGERVYPVITDGETATMVERGASSGDAAAAKFAVVNATPHRLTGRYVFDLEGVAELGGLLEETLRSDLRMEMGYQMDNQIVNGSNASGQVKGILKHLVATAHPALVSTAKSPTQITWAESRNLSTKFLDGKHSKSEEDIRMLVGGDTYSYQRGIFRSGDNAELDAIQAIRNLGSKIRRSQLIPAPKGILASATLKEQYAIWTAEAMSAVAPVWQGIQLIRDPYSNAAKAQVVLTAHMLFDFIIRRTDGWKLFAVNPGDVAV